MTDTSQFEREMLARLLLEQDDEEFQYLLQRVSDCACGQFSFRPFALEAFPQLVDLLFSSRGNLFRECELIECLGYWVACASNKVLAQMDRKLLGPYAEGLELLLMAAGDFVQEKAELIKKTPGLDVAHLAISCFTLLQDRKAALALFYEYPENIGAVCPFCGEEIEDSVCALQAYFIKALDGEGDLDSFNYYLWLNRLLNDWGEQELSATLPFYLGDFVCPECGLSSPAIQAAIQYYGIE